MFIDYVDHGKKYKIYCLILFIVQNIFMLIYTP
jgi:hypothetical protein